MRLRGSLLGGKKVYIHILDQCTSRYLDQDIRIDIVGEGRVLRSVKCACAGQNWG